MVMLTAALDCSEDKNRKFFVMAALVSSAEEWAGFDLAWRARLKEDGLPYFHMNPFAHATTHPQKPFDKSWIGQEARRRKLLKDLLEIIQAHTWHKFGCILPAQSFKMFSDIAREGFMPSMIATAAKLVWPEIEMWRRRERFRQQARMVFEQGDADKGTLIKAIEGMTGRVPSFEYKQDYPEKGIVGFTPLQASDILAFEMQKQAGDLDRPNDEVQFRFPYFELEKIPGDIMVLKAEGAKLMDAAARVADYFDKNPLGGGTVQCNDKSMKAEPEYVEGSEAWDRFNSAMKSVLAVPHAEIQRRIAEHKKEVARNPHRRGPKAKNKAARLSGNVDT
jgi:hypothetical protein